ncbi:retrovirus-related Pol polyprotein from transposon 17.6 [Trichonephila clavipes]|nr:retrovirus-related Pol polyprotein from transposon 17.6 [Trichonephila clavipes]
MICQLVTCDDRRLRIGLGLPQCISIIPSVKRWPSFEPICAILEKVFRDLIQDSLNEDSLKNNISNVAKLSHWFVTSPITNIRFCHHVTYLFLSKPPPLAQCQTIRREGRRKKNSREELEVLMAIRKFVLCHEEGGSRFYDRLAPPHANEVTGLLPTEVSHIIAREADDKANSYEHKAPERTWIDFYYELNTYFNEWIDGLKKDTFNELSDLIITDQLKRKTPFEFKEYYLDEWANMNSPVQLAEKLEEFEDFKRTLKQKYSSPFVKKQEYKFTEKNCRTRCFFTGIGEAQVTTIGSFEHEFKIDDENYSLTWHVVPADKLKFEAVIGSDLLEQASISFTKEGVKLNKYENHAQLMQISAENLQEELDLSHVENRQIKKELQKLIQDYNPEKTASTDVTMRIILKDEEPVCQPPRRLAFTERQEVNKQIEEWLNEGIIRPSSSEYASPIVMVKKKDGSSRMFIDYQKIESEACER